MIGHLKGKVIDKSADKVVISASGVGYIVYALQDTLSTANLGEEFSLWIHTAVRESDISLYGFVHTDELQMFESLLNVSGIGPKSALAIIGVAGVDNLENAIISGDTSLITKVSGVGKKTADKIVLELGGKISTKKEGGRSQEEIDVFEALKQLGYRDRDIQEVLKSMNSEVVGVNERIREALKHLGK